MSKRYQINEDDLAALESELPRIIDRLYCKEGLLDNAMRAKIRRVQAILTNVRWDYGPPGEMGFIPADGDPTPEGRAG